MTLIRKQQVGADEYAAMFGFLEAYDNGRFSNDVGGLLGQLALLREHAPIAREHESEWRRAVSLAVAPN